MKTPMMLIALLALTGCTDTSGDWSGECDVGEFEFDIEMTLEEAEEKITGSGTVTFTEQAVEITESVNITGSRDGDAISLELEPEDVGEVNINATIDGNTLDGTCTWAGIDGSVTMDR